MLEDMIEFRGKEPGPTSVILGGVHGNETCGVEAIRNILPNLAIEKGRVFIGYGNPRAIAANQRFTEANLNRMFKPDDQLSQREKESYEYGRAQFLKTYLNQADALLDIHASRVQHSRRFVICEDNGLPTAKYLPADLVVSGLDAVQPGGTDYYMNSIGKIGVCIECGYLGDPESTDMAVKSIFSFLATRGHVTRETSSREQSRLQVFYMYVTKSSSFSLAKPFEDFETLREGQLIGQDGIEEIHAPRDCVILFSGNRQKAGDEAFLLGTYKTTT
ncbi:succinylglutamate desuccinylase/aspartoacylase family protein [Candidatus Kaiserbacteria bacterium]|nr:succinylglutamate desuccinylase/aspartoacylase family protein [Candidatus Kaiserbacteria bacterium]